MCILETTKHWEKIKPHLHKWKIHLMFIYQNLTLRQKYFPNFSKIQSNPYKNSDFSFYRNWHIDAIKFIWKCKRHKIAKIILGKNKVEHSWFSISKLTIKLWKLR